MRTPANVNIPSLLTCCFVLLNLYPCPTPNILTQIHMFVFGLEISNKGKLKRDEEMMEMTRCLVLFASYNIILMDIFRTSMNYLYIKLSVFLFLFLT